MTSINSNTPNLVGEVLIPEDLAGINPNGSTNDLGFLYNESTGFIYGESGREWTLSLLDKIIVCAYLVFSLGLGLWYGCRKKGGTEEYFLAGRSSSWPLVGLSIFASNISSSTLVGLAGDAYAHGIAVYSYEWMAAVVLVFVAAVLLPGMVKAQVFTVPEILQLMYNSYARYYFSGLTILLSVVLDTAGTLYAGALLLQVLVPGWALWHIMVVLAIIAGLYTITGGLAAVMATDAVQAILLLIGSIIITVWAVTKAGGWSAMVAAQPPGYMSIIRPLDDPIMPWPGLMSVFLLGVYFFATNQFMAQRLLSAGSVQQGQWGALLAGALKLPVLFLMIVPGLAARILYPDLTRPDLVYPTLMFDLLPSGLLGLVLAGFLAALMSQLDSTLNAAATLVTMDWVQKIWPDLSTTRLKLIGQAVTVVVMVIAVAWAPQIRHFPSLFQYFQLVMSCAIPPVLAIYIVGFFWQGATPRAANATLLLGTLVGIPLFIGQVYKIIPFHFIYVPMILITFSVLILIPVSIVTKQDVKKDRIVLWSMENFREETKALKDRPLWQNYRLHSVILLAATAIIVGFFW